MNTTALRPATRTALGDPAGGIYTDAEIDAALADAYHRLAIDHPTTTSQTTTVATGATSITLTADALMIRSVRLPRGTATQGTAADMTYQTHTAAQLMYHLVPPTTLELSRPVQATEAGSWTIRYTTIPAFPTLANVEWSLPDVLEPAAINYAAARLLRTRAYQTQRRGGKGDYTASQQADQLEREALALSQRHKRQARTT